jgi:large subunit ribosomal protein L6
MEIFDLESLKSRYIDQGFKLSRIQDQGHQRFLSSRKSMSRIGNKPITIPAGVSVNINNRRLTAEGFKGKLEITVHPLVSIIQNGGQLTVKRTEETKMAKSVHGTTRARVQAVIVGVDKGFSKKLELIGTGYRAAKQGKGLILSLGFSHPVMVSEVEGINFEVEGNTIINVSGVDKQLVGQTAANIRRLRPPEPYKGKGIKYSDEVVRRKPGKQAKAGTAA